MRGASGGRRGARHRVGYNGPDMRTFLFGLVLGLLGAILWLLVPVVRELNGAPACSKSLYCDPVLHTLQLVGLGFAVLAPIFLSIVIPSYDWVNRHLPERWRDLPPPEEATSATPDYVPGFRARDERN